METKELIEKIKDRYNASNAQIALAIGREPKAESSIRNYLKGNGQLSEAEIHKLLIKYPIEIPTYAKNMLPYFSVDVVASPIEVWNDQTTKPDYSMVLPGYDDCDFACNVYGHSMYPTFESGCIIICKEIKARNLIVYGEVYLIVTSDFRMLKRIQKSKLEDHFLAVSDNFDMNDPTRQKYQPVDIPMKDIIKLYIVKGGLKRYQI